MNQILQWPQSINPIVNTFFVAIESDARIGPTHISLYMALLYLWSLRAMNGPIYIYSSRVMPMAKISGTATYHRSIRELHDYGYIKYVPSNNHILGSLVFILEPPKPVS